MRVLRFADESGAEQASIERDSGEHQACFSIDPLGD
jgi:hypothetical protein